jgi:hypothetical protein
VAEGKHFKTAYGWAGGSKPGGGTYKHPDQIKADREAKKKAKEQEQQKNKQPDVGVAEGSEQKPAITYKDYTLQYDYQTEDDDPEGYSTATTYYFDVLKDGDRVGEAEYFDYFGNLTIRINGKTKEFGFRHPLASQISQLVSSLPDEQKKDLSDPRFESQGLTEVFADQGSGSTDRDNADYMKRRNAAKKAGYTSRETKAGTWRVFKDGNAVAVAGPFKSADQAAAWIKKHKQGVTEDNDALAAFLARGGEVQQLKPQRGPRRSGVSFASKHIGSASGRGNTKGKVSGLGANTGKSGKPVVTAEQGVTEVQLDELFEPSIDYYTLSNGKMVQVDYKPGVDGQGPAPFTDVNVSYVNPALKPQGPSFDSTGQAQRWDRAPDGIKQAIQKFITQPQSVSEMDKSENSAGRDTGLRPGPDKEAKPISKEKMNKDAADVLDKAMSKEHEKKDVAEDSISAMRRLAGIVPRVPTVVSNGQRQYRHMPTAVQPR